MALAALAAARVAVPPEEITAFVRDVVLPGGPDSVPRLDPDACRFALTWGPSGIHRWGIFAAERIPRRRRVIEYTGERIGRAEAFRRRLRPRAYLFRVGPRRAIDGAVGGSGAEFINHGCEPNLVARARGGRVLLVSLRAIERGEELLLDYRLVGDVPWLPCRCGSARCRGFLNLPPPAKAH
jgi:hypothetical protein